MAKKFLVNIDLVGNQILNPLFQILSSDPGSPVEGQFWYNSTADRLKYRANGVTLTPLTDADLTEGVEADISGEDTDPQLWAGKTLHDYIDGVLPTAAVAYSNSYNDLDDLPTLGTAAAADTTDFDPAGSAASAQAYAIQRANHTGTQTASTISDFDTQVRTNRLDQMATPTGAVSFGNQLLTNVATPVAGTDGANKSYVDAAVAGFSWKESVRAATTANITLANEQTVDGVALEEGDRVLVKDQTDPEDNGIYIVVDGGSWTRATDADSESDLLGAAVMAREGTANADTQWLLVTDAPITVGTTGLTFVQFGGGLTYSAGAGIALSGTTFSADLGTGLTFDSNDIVIDTSVVARHYATTVGNGSATSIAVSHNLGTRDVVVDVFDNATYDTVECDVIRTDTNTVTVSFAAAPASNAYRVVVVG